MWFGILLRFFVRIYRTYNKTYKFRCQRDARLRSNVFAAAAEEYVRVLSTSVHGLEMPVGECPCIARGACPSCARGPPGVLFTAHLQSVAYPDKKTVLLL